ncbi:MAG TPA: hypothetical protein VEW69_06910 [Alphaproteobacteria bacterium]|nr:hypothetical protein [Alphaproteobacteria bacterium]
MQRTESQKFYQIIALVFVVIGSFLVMMAVKRHDRFLGVFAGITLLNAVMAMMKAVVAREAGR